LNVELSIVIDCYDQGRFLTAAIESALSQSGPNFEVIVVDDGSRDNSRDVIARYHDAVVPVFKTNGGQASALNAGFDVARGDVVIFLDADDELLPNAAKRALACFDTPEVAKVHWPMRVIDEAGRHTATLHPQMSLPQGDRRGELLRKGPTTEIAPPTSGNAWHRRFLERALPIPEQLYRIGADKHLLELAPFFGELRSCDEPLSLYRRHAGAHQVVSSIEERLALELRFYDCYSEVIENQLLQDGIRIDREAWLQNSWWHRQALALRDIAELPARAGPLVLVDDGAWGSGRCVAGKSYRPFLEHNGVYWGQPGDDATAIAELERMRGEGASYLVFVWSTFWWLDHYRGFCAHLDNFFNRELQNEQVIVFDLQV
jgi:glycosyltransferase involved in cell wall biosynthesis